MTIRIITDDDNKVSIFKSYDAAAEYLINAKNILFAKKSNGTVNMTKEYVRYLNKK